MTSVKLQLMLEVDREASVLPTSVAKERGRGGFSAWEKAKFFSSPEGKGDIVMKDIRMTAGLTLF